MAKKSGIGAIENFYADLMPCKALKTWVSALFRPAGIFDSEKKNAKGKEIATTLASIGLVSGVVWGIVAIIKAAFGLGAATGLASALIVFAVALVIYPIAYIIGGFIDSGVFFILAKILGGKGNYMEQTLGIALICGGMMIVSAPFLVLAAIPVIGMLFSLASFAVMAYGLYSQYLLIKKVHQLSSMRAAAVIIIPVLAFLALMVLALFFLAIAAGMAQGLSSR